METGSVLDNKLSRFVDALTEDEKDAYRILLNHAAGGLGGSRDAEGEEVRDSAFRAVLTSLRQFSPADVLWRSRPSFLSASLLNALQAEAEAGKADAVPTERHLLGCGGSIADAFAVSPELVRLMDGLVPGITPTGIASYIHYDWEGAGIEAHVDTDIFAVNAIIMLKHEFRSDPSHLVLYPPGRPPERIQLAVGEMIVIDAAGLVHEREPMRAGESVSILTIGFQPSGVASRPGER